jgi:N6-L-threonylcarbamoyladenine synthase
MLDIVLGIETSCDETAAALINSKGKILSNVISSQILVHRPYGGVVPELASRHHIINIVPVIKKALREAKVTLKEIKGVAVTIGPGLIGSLLVGLQVAKALAFSLNIPMIGVNHLEGHLFAIFATQSPPEVPDFPFIGLIVSGGHTATYRVNQFGSYRLLGQTRDDAAGEAFDKVAKLLGLPYPGGVAIAKNAEGGDPHAILFPRAMRRSKSLDFSFSGLKTAASFKFKSQKNIRLKDFCASFQEAVVDSILEKTFAAIEREKISTLVISGGVAANTLLRTKAQTIGKEKGTKVFYPHPSVCTDNAAMIAYVGLLKIQKGEYNKWNLNAYPNLQL